MRNFTIVLPACNEEEGIAHVLTSILDAHYDADVIVVDDCSTDRTAEIARTFPVTVMTHSINLGAGKSVKDGIAQAKTDRIVMMDSDGTYPVESIPELLATLDCGYDLVVGARHGHEYNGRIFKKAARFVFRCLAEFATGKRIPDINSGMRAFHKSVISDYFPHLCNGFSLPTTMTLAYFFTGRKVAYMPIEYHKRFGRSKVKIFRDGLRTLQYMTESIAHYNPLKLFLLLAILSVVCGGVSFHWIGISGIFIGIFAAILIFALGVAAESMRGR